MEGRDCDSVSMTALRSFLALITGCNLSPDQLNWIYAHDNDDDDDDNDDDDDEDDDGGI